MNVFVLGQNAEHVRAMNADALGQSVSVALAMNADALGQSVSVALGMNAFVLGQNARLVMGMIVTAPGQSARDIKGKNIMTEIGVVPATSRALGVVHVDNNTFLNLLHKTESAVVIQETWKWLMRKRMMVVYAGFTFVTKLSKDTLKFPSHVEVIKVQYITGI